MIGSCVGLGAFAGGAGSPAITLPGTGITVNIDVDDGFIWGGGGGGGGGAAVYGVGPCLQGGGGGGAQGWDVNSGGTAFAPAVAGGSGNSAGEGSGGAGESTAGDGGDGGSWGTAGDNGTGTGPGLGGIGGRAIIVPVADTLSLSGAKNQATLEGEGRLLGRNGDPIGT